MRALVLIAAPLLALVLPFAAAHADGRERDELQRQVERGEIRPLSEILAAVRSALPGEVVKVEVERHHDAWVYEVRVLGTQGRIFQVYVDARSATVQRVKEK